MLAMVYSTLSSADIYSVSQLFLPFVVSMDQLMLFSYLHSWIIFSLSYGSDADVSFWSLPLVADWAPQRNTDWGKEPKEGRVITSPFLALRSNCGYICIQVYERYLVKRTETQPIQVIWLLMKKRLHKMTEHTSGSRLKLFLSPND